MATRKTAKLAAGLMAGALLFGVTACSGTTDDSDDAADATDATGKVYYLNFKPEQADDWVALAKQYTEETGVQVDVQTAASGTYETTLKSEMAKSEAPTLFQVNGPVGLQTWKDYAADLSDTEIYAQLNDQSIALTNDDGNPVAIPYVMETYGIIYNKAILEDYIKTDGAKVTSVDEITSFDTLKSVVEDIQAKKDDLGIDGAFTSAGFDSSSDWRFKTHLANIPLYYEYKADGIVGQPASIKGTYLDGFKNIFDLYINNSTTEPSLLSGKTIDDANSEFALGQAVFYQNGTWAYNDIKDQKVDDADMGMLPIYIGADGEENQGLTTGSENYWVVNSEASEADQKASVEFADYESSNPLVQADAAYTAAGKTAVTWNFTTMPSEEWKNTLGQAMLAYAQGTGDWDAVRAAFVDNWATEVELSNQG